MLKKIVEFIIEKIIVLAVLTPIFCLACAPYVLIISAKKGQEPYWKKVRHKYSDLLISWFKASIPSS